MSALSARCLLNACLFLVSLFSVALLACLFTQFFQRSLPTLASHAISYLNSHLKKRVHNEFFACLNSLLQKWAIFAEETWRVLGSLHQFAKDKWDIKCPTRPKTHGYTRIYVQTRLLLFVAFLQNTHFSRTRWTRRHQRREKHSASNKATVFDFDSPSQ